MLGADVAQAIPMPESHINQDDFPQLMDTDQIDDVIKTLELDDNDLNNNLSLIS